MSDELNNEDADDSKRVSRLSTAEIETEDQVVKEYEERYYGPPITKAKMRDKPRSYSTFRVTDEERLWAAVAHGSVWITFITGFLTAGFSVPVSVFIPLVIYFMFRKRSDYVAFHALQAFVLQLIGTLGALALLVIGGAAWVVGLIVALVAIAILIGFVLVPVWGLVGIALLLVAIGLPFAMLLFGTIATIETYNGRDYRYPFVARWVDRQLAGGFLNAM
jgi:uncharacterized Tic20 family protein